MSQSWRRNDVILFFKQKTAYEMRISDWSSDVCSSDLSLFGRIFDAIGTRMGFTLSIVVWSLSIAAHALVRSMPLLVFLRATLGVSEAGNWPGAAKANALRSEEHTSELQSLMRISYAVFCLKKKK